MAQDLTGLLGGALLPQVQPAMSYEQSMMQRGAEYGKGFRQGAGGMFGVDTRTTPEFVQEEVAKLNPESVEDQAKIVELVGKINPAGAVALKSAFAQKAVELVKEKKLQDFSTGQQKALVKYLEANYPSFADAAKGDTPLITAANWKDFKEKAGSTKNQFGGTKLVKDENENLYYVTQSLDPTEDGNAAKTVYSPVTPNAPSQPSGAVTVVGDSGETPAERKAREISTSTGKIVGKGFATLQGEAAKNYSETQESIYTADRLIEIQNQIDTGGFQPVFAKAITDFLGTTAGDVGEFEYLVKNKMIQKLRAFGSNPTEGERKAADELVESLKKSKKVNLAQLQSYKKEMERRAAREEFLLQDDITQQEYKDFVIAQYESKETEDTDTIDFNSLKKQQDAQYEQLKIAKW